MPYLQHVFETIAFAKVSESAAQARELGFLGEQDVIVMNPSQLIGEAKRAALALAAGYRAPERGDAPIYALGERGKAALLRAARQLERGGQISAHDGLIAARLAHVLAGGDLSAPQWVGEQYILELERQAFAALLGEAKTQERIAHTLRTRKPLRN
jgi:3-hydroxyacyl-CoA dehydrogenase